MKAASKSATTANAQDAITLLTGDHKTVQKLFKDYEKLTQNDADEEEKAALAQQICTELTVHAQIEEEIFYPAVRDAIEEQICWMRPKLSTRAQKTLSPR